MRTSDVPPLNAHRLRHDGLVVWAGGSRYVISVLLPASGLGGIRLIERIPIIVDVGTLKWRMIVSARIPCRSCLLLS